MKYAIFGSLGRSHLSMIEMPVAGLSQLLWGLFDTRKCGTEDVGAAIGVGCERQAPQSLVRDLIDRITALVCQGGLHHLVKAVLRLVSEHRARLLVGDMWSPVEGHRDIEVGPFGTIGD